MITRKCQKSLFILIATLTLTLTLCKKSDPENKPKWAKKDIRDFDDADLERLLDQWEEDEDPLPDDELPEYMKKPKDESSLPFDKIGKLDPDDIMKMTKKGKTVMMFINLSGDPARHECEEITSLWQGALRNNHIQAERYVIEDSRAIFLFHDGAQAWEAKEFLLQQDGLKDLTLEGQLIQGKGGDFRTATKSKTESKDTKDDTKEEL